MQCLTVMGTVAGVAMGLASCSIPEEGSATVKPGQGRIEPRSLGGTGALGDSLASSSDLTCTDGSCSYDPSQLCGDGVCSFELGENCTNCPQDCAIQGTDRDFPIVTAGQDYPYVDGNGQTFTATAQQDYTARGQECAAPIDPATGLPTKWGSARHQGDIVSPPAGGWVDMYNVTNCGATPPFRVTGYRDECDWFLPFQVNDSVILEDPPSPIGLCASMPGGVVIFTVPLACPGYCAALGKPAWSGTCRKAPGGLGICVCL